jgi:hypothetical protein
MSVQNTVHPPTTVTVDAWEDDPANAAPVPMPEPDLANPAYAVKITAHRPPPKVYPEPTADFRYWNAAVALRRAADFWSQILPNVQWHPGPSLPVDLDHGVDLNAYYDRKGLKFFHDAALGGVVYSGESPDVVCHELGHAILDSFKPQLWGAASLEAAAFHEAFGDMSAMLAALQLGSIRTAVLAETHGRLQLSSRLSRLAEQLGAAIRAQAPQAVDPDCLRNAANRFTYQDPLTLPSNAPASQLSSEAHSFSRVFSGAFLEALAGLLVGSAANPSAPTEQELLRVSQQIGQILVRGVKRASVVSNFYAQVAGGMVVEADAVKAGYAAILKRVFVRRGILSLQSASGAMSLVGDVEVAEFAAAVAPSELPQLALSGQLFGLGDAAVFVQAPSQPRTLSAMSVAPGFGSQPSPSSETAARAFVDHLLTRDKVDRTEIDGEDAYALHRRQHQSHKLVRRPNGLALERRYFDCGLCSAKH